MRPSLLSAVALTIVALYAMPAAAQILDDASVEFEDQTMDGDMVVVASVTLPEGGFVVIHDDALNDGDATGSVVGVSEYLEAGTHTDVNITVQVMTNGGNDTGGTNNTGNEITLIAMPHMDTNNNQEYDFVDSNGQDDGPYTETVGGGAVTDEARVTMDGQGGLDDGLDDPGSGQDEDDGVVDDDEDAPGFGVVALLALLGAVAVLARRR